MSSGDLITRVYPSFRGVDFRGNEIDLVRSPDCLNVWKDYRELDSIRTRPDLELDSSFDNTVYGVFFYTVGRRKLRLIHAGTTLYKEENGQRETLYTGLNPTRSQSFIYNNIFYFKDGINYLEYNGETIGEVAGTVPTTSIGRKPSGGGTVYQDVNMLTGYRKNTFLADGKSTEFFLDAQGIDTDFIPIVTVNGADTTDFTVDTTNGKIIFNQAPPEPLTDGQDNVTVKFKKTVPGYRDRINKCTLLTVFDNRVFFSGNQDYPSTVWHSSLNDPGYCSDLDYYNEGLDLSPVRAMVAGNNALWVFKEPSQANTTVFYHNPVIDAEYGKIYPSTHSSISTGCVAAGVNFNDDIAFFSPRGMEAINGDVTTEQVIAHRSSLVDRMLLEETDYNDMILEEWEGYLLVIVGSKVYLADSRAMLTVDGHAEYEWFYWELDRKVTCTRVHDGQLYLGTSGGNNMLSVPYVGKTGDSFGVTWTAHADGSVTAKGTATANSSFILEDTLSFKAGKTYTLSDGIIISYYNKSGVKNWVTRIIKWEEGYKFEFSYLQVSPGTTVDATFYPQIQEGIQTPYSPQHGLYTLTDLISDVESYWITPLDKFKHPHFQKTSNKRGCTVEATGDISVYAKTDKTEWELIDTHDNVTDYFVCRIKRKKFKDIQLKFYSESRFSLESCSLECFIGGYIKR